MHKMCWEQTLLEAYLGHRSFWTFHTWQLQGIGIAFYVLIIADEISY